MSKSRGASPRSAEPLLERRMSVRREAQESGQSLPLATIGEVAAFLRIPSRTLYQWRYRGKGPPAYRVGRHLRFRWLDVEAWLEEDGRASNRS